MCPGSLYTVYTVAQSLQTHTGELLSSTEATLSFRDIISASVFRTSKGVFVSQTFLGEKQKSKRGFWKEGESCFLLS